MQNTEPTQPRRRFERISLALPVRVEAKENKEDSWNEVTRFYNVSQCGAGFEVKRQIKVGQLVQLTSPIPQKLRCYDYSEDQYRVWGIVRYCTPSKKNADCFFTGVAFIGKNPPASYHEDPSRLYGLLFSNKLGFFELAEGNRDVTTSQEPELKERRHQRHPIPIEVFLEALDESEKPIAYETTVSENVSVSGAAVFTTLDVQVGQKVKVNCISYNISILARVCNRRIGPDGMPRLHLEFIDRELPLEGIN